MKTNFFEALAGLNFKGNLRMNIHQDENGVQTVSVLLTNEELKGNPPNLPPLLFKGLATELDEGFFSQLIEPVKQTEVLLKNLKAYQAELEKAKKTAKPEKNKPAKTDNAEDGDKDGEDPDDLFKPQADDKQVKAEKKRLFDEAMIKTKELAKQMKYAEALAQLPDAGDYPEQAALIEAKRQEVQAGKDLYDKLQEQFND